MFAFQRYCMRVTKYYERNRNQKNETSHYFLTFLDFLLLYKKIGVYYKRLDRFSI